MKNEVDHPEILTSLSFLQKTNITLVITNKSR